VADITPESPAEFIGMLEGSTRSRDGDDGARSDAGRR
jgi:hypothetical protein